jgi:hypothetical protein
MSEAAICANITSSSFPSVQDIFDQKLEKVLTITTMNQAIISDGSADKTLRPTPKDIRDQLTSTVSVGRYEVVHGFTACRMQRCLEHLLNRIAAVNIFQVLTG